MRAAIALLLSTGLSFAVLADEAKVDAKAHLQGIERAIDNWDIEAAKKEIAELEKVAPSNVEPLQYFKGRVAFEEGRYDEAVDLLAAAGVQDKIGSYIRLAKDTQKLTHEHQKAVSEHFIFFYPKGKDEILAPYALETLEAIREALATDLRYAPPGKIRVEVVNNAAELAKVSTLTYEQIRTTGTIAICKFSKLMITSPKAVVRGYDWLDTLAHEFVHLVVTQKSHNTVPIWLHEGLAKFFESRWRGKPGLSLSPSTLALLGERMKKGKLVSFERMHPSIALLPSAEDAATAFAEVFLAVDLVYREQGAAGLRAIIEGLAAGRDDKKAVEDATHKNFSAFEKDWLAYLRKQPFPRELIPRTGEKVVLKEEGARKKQEVKNKGKEINFADFGEVEETDARKMAHLGELMRERGRIAAAAQEYRKAHSVVGDKYESVSNKYALALLELRQVDEAEHVLQASLRIHPSAATTNVHLGRIYLWRQDYPKAKAAFLEALAEDPFDPEIHLSLLRVYRALGTRPLAERARSAAMTLTALPADQVDRIAATLGKSEGELAEQAALSKDQPDAGDLGSHRR